jgi:hypothetical protein
MSRATVVPAELLEDITWLLEGESVFLPGKTYSTARPIVTAARKRGVHLQTKADEVDLVPGILLTRVQADQIKPRGTGRKPIYTDDEL